MNAIDRFFKLHEQGTTFRREIVAGAATFLTMSHIVVVNPLILGDAGMDFGAVFTATILAAAIGTGIMGLWANWPVALAPGMGLNVFFTYGVVLGMGHPWQAALGAVFCSGVLFMALSASGFRRWVLEAMPKSLRLGIGAGIGLFLAFIGLRNAGVVVGHPDTLVAVGDLTRMTVLLACAGFFVMTLLESRRITGAIVISIVGITVIGLIVGEASWSGGAWLPPSPAPTLFALDIAAVFELGLVVVVLTFLFVDFFDTAGTLTSVAVLAGKVRKDGSIDNIGRAVMSDSVATTAGSLLGTSSTTSYIESAAGIREGGRTGLTAVTCAALFLLCLFLAPLVRTIPDWAVASALVFVGVGYVSTLRDLDWADAEASVPAVLAAIVMPFTFSIANGIAVGFISYAVIKVVTGNARELHPAVGLLAAAGLLYFLKDF